MSRLVDKIRSDYSHVRRLSKHDRSRVMGAVNCLVVKSEISRQSQNTQAMFVSATKSHSYHFSREKVESRICNGTKLNARNFTQFQWCSISVRNPVATKWLNFRPVKAKFDIEIGSFCETKKQHKMIVVYKVVQLSVLGDTET